MQSDHNNNKYIHCTFHTCALILHFKMNFGVTSERQEMKGYCAFAHSPVGGAADTPDQTERETTPEVFPFSLSETLICRAPSLTFLSGRVSYLSTVPIMVFSFMNTHSQRQADGDYYKPSACAQNAVRFQMVQKCRPWRQIQRNETTVAVWMPTL